jgi:hypothetical protein
MAKEWCVEGMKIKLSAGGTTITGGVVKVTTSASTKLKIKDKTGAMKGVYFGPVTITFSGTSYGAYTQTSPGSITFNQVASTAKAKYSTEQHKPILIKEDTAQTTSPVTYVASCDPPPTTQLTVKAEITDAMQTYMKEL